ncbi:hypothetical protein CUR86_10650 [Salinicola acroporae]|uniref:Uncharacterized protein n=1 Tax=Salinicola acroporae TaxID=1541440 RepID=A0ABT6I5U8_9GAMM|nr:hypothetical protein [Salinicola acroporae]
MSEKSASDGQTRQKLTKKRSLRGVNEHFESIFNAVWASAGIFQTERRVLSVTLVSPTSGR